MTSRLLAPLVLAVLVGLSSPAAASEPNRGGPTPADNLGQRVAAALATSGARTVAAAVDVDGLGVVLRREADHQLPPASVQKAFVGYAALRALPAGTRLRTEVATTGVANPDGKLWASLWLVAGGDPYLTSAGLRALARSVRATGVREVVGSVYLDDTRYDAAREPSGWRDDFMPDESGPLSALAVDRNARRTDSGYLADPAFPAAVQFRADLRAEGVVVRGTVKRLARPAAATTIAERTSGPIEAVVRRVMKESDNFASELLLKEVGYVVGGRGTSAGGIAAVRSVLGQEAVPFGAGSDGSGLSRYDRQSPNHQLALLGAAAASPLSAAFKATLPIACRDGTLKTRMCGTVAEGRVLAKTGTLTGVRVLSGYTTTASGRAAWFAFTLTGVTDGTKARTALDRAAIILAGAPE
ncbi:MAG TPA: D-alanyl-D-alanine carboxypeptidase/D-alanyl-D-alanine-endopeptidase [Mycobacteriales bacterium]|nr:D-alanyl-D-alanine carboxypeptidase/D-alanyl-D-alanine-endopeptidase [Mycobacteriales bacterium]